MTDTDVRRIEDKVDGVTVALARLEGSLSPTLQKLTENQDDTDKIIADLETRIRGLERFRFSVPSLAVLSLALDGVLGFFLLVHK